MKILIIGGCGYIGSRLYGHLSAEGHSVDSLDLEKRGNPAAHANRVDDYGNLTRADLAPYEVVVHLAAHASVGEALADPDGAFENNVISFHRLLSNLDGRRLLYASSSSVYTGLAGILADEDSSWSAMDNMYDFSKFVDDGLASLSDAECFGLRFGTVNGPSPNLRQELMLNRMVRMALDERVVEISSVHVHRPILAMQDLCRAISAIITGDGSPGIYNLASFNSTVFELGNAVSNLLQVPVQIGEDRRTYDFSVATEKFSKEYDFDFQESIESVVADLVHFYATVHA